MTENLAWSRAVIDLDAYAHNLAVVREMIPPECEIMPVVKADAYGHGAVPIARRAVAEGISTLAVATVDEAMALVDAGVHASILVLITPPDAALSTAIQHHLRVMVSSVSAAERIGELARRANTIVPIHCKIDTGMGRQGSDPDTAVPDLLHLTHVSHIDIEGIATHFAVADDARDPFTPNQIKVFKSVLKRLDRAGIPFETVHAANSAAIVNFPVACTFDMVRPGLMTYGVWPSNDPPELMPLEPVMRWETRVSLLKNLPEGSTIGYGRTYTAQERMWAALVPVGYADGYKAALGNRGRVLIRGERCPVRGRVSMDQIVVDVTHVPGVSVGDTVTLIGSDGAQTITVAELAEQAGTIPYDILTGIGSRVQRVYSE